MPAVAMPLLYCNQTSWAWPEMVETTSSGSSEELPAPETYGAEERLADALEQLPTPAMIGRLMELLKPDELREVAEGIMLDCTEATRKQDILENAEAINSWIATAEEIITTRKRFRTIQKTREEIRAKYQKTE